ncbi:MAG: peptidylprolyl isomerase [Planctomycetota bacterium]|nr:peptidylprolyl isomerase [Planctomycetota bacterium]
MMDHDRILFFSRAVMPLLLLCALLGGKSKAEATPPSSSSYEESLQAWKTQIKKLQGIRDRLAVSQGDDQADLRKEYMQAVADAKPALRNFTAAAEVSLSEGDQHQEEAASFLEERMGGLLDADDFERAFRIGELLLDRGYDNRTTMEAAGIAAVMTNHFQSAREYLQQADQKEPLSSIGKEMLADIADMEAAWKQEEEIRKAEAKADDLPRVRLQTTQGDVVVELFENESPETVANFIDLVENGFYEELDFHRVIPHRVAQGGCPNGDGTGGPGYSIRCEREDEDYRRHFRGSLSMARTSELNSAGSQFFFCMAPLSDLDGQYTVFGRIIEGMDVLAKLQRQDGKSELLPPADRILKAIVERKRDHAYRAVPYAPTDTPTDISTGDATKSDST